MEATVLYGARDVRFEDRPEPTIIEPTDAVIRLPFTCICGSDLWPYRGIQPVSSPTAMGHEYCGFVEEVGRDVTAVEPGQFVIGSSSPRTTRARTAVTAIRRPASASNRLLARRRRTCACPSRTGRSSRLATSRIPT
jgi:threonine dehydrogenase-like Zn-dependent dehydrogenase